MSNKKTEALSKVPWLFFAIAAFASVQVFQKQSIDFHARRQATINTKKIEAMSEVQKSFSQPAALKGLSKIYSVLGQQRNPGSVKDLD